jgi:hypothetical protein
LESGDEERLGQWKGGGLDLAQVGWQFWGYFGREAIHWNGSLEQCDFIKDYEVSRVGSAKSLGLLIRIQNALWQTILLVECHE